MAGGRIKGITIELNGDSSKLEASLKSVNTEIRNTESKLKDVNKLLKMDPGNTNLLSQKYKTLQQEIQATKQKLDTLKEASKQADQALKDGTISKEQYDALQREIAETEQKLKGLEQEYKNFGSVQAQQVAAAGEKMKELGGKMESAAKTMTRFERELSGALGAYWKSSAEKEIRKMEERQMNGEIFFGADGVVRWTGNNHVMPKDSREILAHTAYSDLFSEEASRAAEEAETAAFLESCRKNYQGPSEEEKAEMETAFGKGTTVVNIITGERIRL